LRLQVYLLLELCTGGELFDHIKEQGSFSEADAANIVRQILRVTAECHLNGIIHRDLKPENFLYASKGLDVLKAIDFGLSDFFKPDTKFTRIVGSPYYVAPEVLKKNYGPAADVWSVGVIAYVLLCGGPPFWGETDEELFDSIIDVGSPFCFLRCASPTLVLPRPPLGHLPIHGALGRTPQAPPRGLSAPHSSFFPCPRQSRSRRLLPSPRIPTVDIPKGVTSSPHPFSFSAPPPLLADFCRGAQDPLDLETDPWPNVSESAKDLLRRLLTKDGRLRLSASQALSHPWVREGGAAPQIPLCYDIVNSLHQFSKQSALKRLFFKNFAQNWDAKHQLQSLADQFTALDKDNSGKVTLSEFQAAIEVRFQLPSGVNDKGKGGRLILRPSPPS